VEKRLYSLDSLGQQRLLDELDQALECHYRWIAQVNRTLLYGPSAGCDRPEMAHRSCLFGQWYHAVRDDHVTGNAAFIEVGDAHAALHEIARRLLEYNATGRDPSITDYDALVAASEQMRCAVETLKSSLKHALYTSSALLSNVFENAYEGVLITDAAAVIVNINQAFTRITGYSADEVIGCTPRILSSGRQNERFYRRMWDDLTHNGNWHGQVWNRHKNGELFLESLSISAVRNQSGQVTHYLGVIADVTSEYENEKALFHLAHFDTLTGLANRVMFLRQLREALQRAESETATLALLYLDIDGFKDINDALGHYVGDELLREVSRRLRKTMRRSDQIGRLGGDEFVIILPDFDTLDAVVGVAEKILSTLKETCTLDNGQVVQVTASIGISLYPVHGTDSDTLLRHADQAMYQAKQDGRDRWSLCEISGDGARRGATIKA